MNVAKKVLHIPKKCLGEGQIICFIDTGIEPHCDFLLCDNRIEKFIDFINEKDDYYDDNGHGTFVAGVCCGSGIISGQKFSGIAPKAKIISLKALDKKGEANSTKILEAMQWVFDNKDKIDIVCMSFGSDPIGQNDPIMIGAEKLWDSGIVVVAAAGNSGPEYQTIKSPGVSRKIITVGGFDDNRFDDDEFNSNYFEMASFSSRGPCYRYFKPDVVAPAVDIVSCGIDKDYVKLSGTSVATPMIAGICALIKEKDKNLSPNQVKNKLLSICKPAFFNRNFEGFGIPDLNKFFNN
jgi:serine protease AprX